MMLSVPLGHESYESSWISPSLNWYMGFCGSVSSRASRAAAGTMELLEDATCVR